MLKIAERFAKPIDVRQHREDIRADRDQWRKSKCDKKFVFYICWMKKKGKKTHAQAFRAGSAHYSIADQLKWSWGGPLFEIKALLAGFRGAGGIPTLVALSALVRAWRIRRFGIIPSVICITAVVRCLCRSATWARCTWAWCLPWIHVTWNTHDRYLHFYDSTIRLPRQNNFTNESK